MKKVIYLADLTHRGLISSSKVFPFSISDVFVTSYVTYDQLGTFCRLTFEELTNMISLWFE